VTATRLAVVLGVAVLGALCFLAAIGFTPLVAPLVTVVLLVVLVGGGNLLSDRGQKRSRRPRQTDSGR
jgi:hypothetical protein